MTPWNELIRIEKFKKGNMEYILKVTRISFVNAPNPELLAVVRAFYVVNIMFQYQILDT